MASDAFTRASSSPRLSSLSIPLSGPSPEITPLRRTRRGHARVKSSGHCFPPVPRGKHGHGPQYPFTVEKDEWIESVFGLVVVCPFVSRSLEQCQAQATQPQNAAKSVLVELLPRQRLFRLPPANIIDYRFSDSSQPISAHGNGLDMWTTKNSHDTMRKIPIPLPAPTSKYYKHRLTNRTHQQ